MQNRPLKIVYCTPALYMAGGVERVLTLKANYFAEHFGYDITIILTEGKDNRRQEAERKKKSCRCPTNPNKKQL